MSEAGFFMRAKSVSLRVTTSSSRLPTALCEQSSIHRKQSMFIGLTAHFRFLL
jgi:hypothetical protein